MILCAWETYLLLEILAFILFFFFYILELSGEWMGPRLGERRGEGERNVVGI